MQKLQQLIDSLQNFAQKRLQFQDPPKLFLKQDQENAKNILGKTAYYDPNEKSITLFTTGRHPKDILRSFAHELVHHAQNLRGDLSPEKCGEMGMGYAQTNPHMREMEREAYEKGNLCFRDWEDNYKTQINIDNVTINLKENKKMVKISKKELKGLIGKILEARMEEEAKKVATPPEEIERQETERKMKYVKLEQTEELEENEDTDEVIEETSEEINEEAPCPQCGEVVCKCPVEENTDSIQTPEQEQSLYESRFGKRNEELFSKLKKLWTK
tara:strand:- start:1119 stop:1934 length:816 start_codon:yes stop_codon:yes gene_type:complete